MKAVLLAAGKGTRTYPLTLTRPKPLLTIANKTILQHNLEQLNGLVDEVIIIVGYKAEMIKKKFRNNFNGLKLVYIEQKEQLGTAHAVEQAKNLLDEKFLVMNGDDVFFKEDIENVLKNDFAVLVKRVKNPEQFGVCKIENSFISKIIEKPKEFVSDLANTGLYLLPKKVFNYQIEKSERGEYEIVDFVSLLLKDEKVKAVEAKAWFPLAFSWDLLKANEYLLSKIEKKTEGKVEDNVVIKGNAIIGKNTIVKSGVYIEGPAVIGENCVIGPNAYLRPSTSIGNNCKIGHEVEIKNSIIMDNTAVPHLSYIGDSILGENVNIGAGSITANFRHDAGLIRSSVKTEYKSELVDTGLIKFGTVIGDNTKLGVRTLIYPGRKIWPNMTTLPGEIVKEDKER